MWHWDQGHLGYFQFDAIRVFSQYVRLNDFKAATRDAVAAATGYSFAAPPTHSPWRQYSRALKLCLLVSENAGVAEPTAVAELLAQPGMATCDEYLHFLAQAATEPSPALEAWRPDADFRYPLLFALKYLLAKASVATGSTATLDEIIGAYRHLHYVGSEDDTAYITATANELIYAPLGRSAPEALRRQARESLKVLCQVSYLHLESDTIFVNLDKRDAADVFADLRPVGGPRAPDRDAEIRRLALLFAGGTTQDFFAYPNTVMNEVVESGFREGNKVKKTHVTIERNSGLRAAYFQANPTATCDVCLLDTASSYPWTERVMDLHHLLPLCSGTRVESGGTTFSDLVPLCPSCHRAVHRYYDNWFREIGRRDFDSRDEAVGVYSNMKQQFPGLIHA